MGEMKYFYDLEFLDDGNTIELISLGMVREDGKSFYGIAVDADWYTIAEHDWLMENVVPQLLPTAYQLIPKNEKYPRPEEVDHPAVMTTEWIKSNILDLIGNDPYVELWADYGAYDHVCLMQLWGPMVSKPKALPMWTHDLRQEWERHGRPPMPQQPDGRHNALADAEWVKHCYGWLNRDN
jgi:hypothetical protein